MKKTRTILFLTLCSLDVALPTFSNELRTAPPKEIVVSSKTVASAPGTDAKRSKKVLLIRIRCVLGKSLEHI